MDGRIGFDLAQVFYFEMMNYDDDFWISSNKLHEGFMDLCPAFIHRTLAKLTVIIQRVHFMYRTVCTVMNTYIHTYVYSLQNNLQDKKIKSGKISQRIDVQKAAVVFMEPVAAVVVGVEV